MLLWQLIWFQCLSEIGIHEISDDVEIIEAVQRHRVQNIFDLDYILMFEEFHDFDLTQQPLS